MNSYEFELHSLAPNKLITITSDSLITAYHTAVKQFPNALAIVSTDPTFDLRNL